MLRIVGILLLVAGLAGLAVGTFQYSRRKDVLNVGPLHVQAKETETVAVPPLVAAGVAALGLVLVVAGRKK
ncbi:MAG TPA: hypothetical protein VGB87_14410 [Vicinamibacteria bacterium]